MQWYKSKDAQEGAEAMASRISSVLNSGKRVLWLVCGGSNISVAVKAMEAVRRSVASEAMVNLTVAQTDERYGKVGHRDSNWKQMQDAGFRMDVITALPVLVGRSLAATVSGYGDSINVEAGKVKASGGIVVGMFGIGADGHIAGILPGSAAATDKQPVNGYEAGQFIRITLTPSFLRNIDVAYAFVFGGPKQKALKSLKEERLPIVEQPAQILNELPEASLYTDL